MFHCIGPNLLSSAPAFSLVTVRGVSGVDECGEKFAKINLIELKLYFTCGASSTIYNFSFIPIYTIQTD